MLRLTTTIPRAVLLLAAATFVGHSLSHPFVEDLYWQQWLGEAILRTHAMPRALGPETFTAAGAPYVPQEWLFSLLHAAGLAYGGDWLVLLLPALAAVVAAALIVVRCEREDASPGAKVIAVTACLLLMVPYMSIRVQLIVWPLFVAVLYLLDSAPRRAWLWAVPLTAAWANVHASAAMVPAVCLLDAASSAVVRRFGEAFLRAALSIATAAALFATPLGPALPRYAVMLAASPIRRYISEWRPMQFSDVDQLLVVAVVGFGVACAFAAWKRRSVEAGRAIAFAIMAFASVRYVPFFAFAAAPLAATGWTNALAWYRRRVPRGVRAPERLGGVATALVVACAVAVLLALARYVPVNVLRDDPRPTVGSIARESGEHRLYCDDFAWCSVGLQYPNVRVFLDGRADPFPLTVWHDWNTIRWTDRGWQAALRRYGVNTILTKPGSKLATALGHDAAWRAVSASGPLRVFERGSLR